MYRVSEIINGWLIKFFTTDDFITNRIPRFDSFSVDIKYVDLITK